MTVAHATPILYKITDLGSLGGSSAMATSINAAGQTAGVAVNIYGQSRALSGSQDITPSGVTDSMASAINDSGQIAGTSFVGGNAKATVWNDGAPQYLDAAAGAYAMGINNLGQVTGMAVTDLGFGHAFLTTGNDVTDLGVLPGGTWSSGYSVNDGGQVVGYANTLSGSFRGFLWSGGSGMTALDTFGGQNSYAMAVNASGQVAGSAQLSTGYMRAFLFDNDEMHDLGTLGGSSSYGYGINGSGNEVGFSYVANGDRHGFVYIDGILYDLNDLLVAGNGWVLTGAFGINDAGQIAGSGLFKGVEHAFRLDPVISFAATDLGDSRRSGVSAVPEPSSILLVAFGAGLIWIGRRSPRFSL